MQGTPAAGCEKHVERDLIVSIAARVEASAAVVLLTRLCVGPIAIATTHLEADSAVVMDTRAGIRPTTIAPGYLRLAGVWAWCRGRMRAGVCPIKTRNDDVVENGGLLVAIRRITTRPPIQPCHICSLPGIQHQCHSVRKCTSDALQVTHGVRYHLATLRQCHMSLQDTCLNREIHPELEWALRVDGEVISGTELQIFNCKLDNGTSSVVTL